VDAVADENGRAYPEFLIRYYKGKRNKKRTPFASRAEAAAAPGFKLQRQSSYDSRMQLLPAAAATAAPPPLMYAWEWYDGSTWVAYDDAAVQALNAAFQAGQPTATLGHTLGHQYEVDFQANSQTNTTSGTKRKIRKGAARP
jgi:hypothetical protein